MIIKSLAAEDPSISTLNYAPGPLETAMFKEASVNTGDDEVRQFFSESLKEGKTLTTEQTTRKLVRVLGEKKYTKGEHVDYYELPDE